MFHHILIPVDFSETSNKALEMGVRMAREQGSEVTLLHVGAVPEVYATDLSPAAGALPGVLLDLYQKMAEKQKAALEALAAEKLPPELTHHLRLREGFPPDEVLDEAKHGHCDLIVMGTHGYSGMKRALLGSVTDRVVRASPIPVLVVR